MECYREIWLKHRHTEIGKKWRFSDINTVEDFRQILPLTKYEDYQPYIKRIVENGEQNLLTSEPVAQFAPSSGTTGHMKLIPMTNVSFGENLPRPSGNDKILFLALFHTFKPTTPSGIPIGYLSERISKFLMEGYPSNYLVPPEAYDLDSFGIGLYLQMLCGLKNASVNLLKAPFIPTVLNGISLLKSDWRQLLQDIRLGRVDPSISIDCKLRRIVENSLGGADPERADQLQAVFEQSKEVNFKDLLLAIWPKLKMIECGCSGTMSSYIPTLQHYATSVHISSFIYACSEAGVFGVSAKPGKETSLFRLLPHNFYEFIPLANATHDNPSTLLSSEVKKGNIYELVLTTPASGFCRYRLGDFVKVIEQTKEGPLIDLCGRGKMRLDLHPHVLYEMNMELALTALTSITSSRIDYIVSVDVSCYNQRYKVWLEIEDNTGIEVATLDEFIDKSLQNVDQTYSYHRSNDLIRQIAVARVANGTFSMIMDFMKSKTLNAEMQLKIPRMIIDNDQILTILESNLQ